MEIIYSPDHEQHSPVFETYEGVIDAYAETPKRIENIKEALELAGYKIVPPSDFSDELVTSVHFERYVDYIQGQSRAIATSGELQRDASNHVMDRYAPVTKGTYAAARTAANVALTAATKVAEGTPAYGLCRPPGHHAAPQTMGGYCYFNNASIAANYLAQDDRVAILDIDFHHGNGTQEIFYDRDDVLYVSLHANPDEQFPYILGREDETGRGAGEGYNLNIILPKKTRAPEYLEAMETGLAKIAGFNPGHVVVSLGFDTYHKDPIAGFKLGIKDYAKIGERLGRLEQPTTLIQEGGYCVDALGQLATSFLKGFLVDHPARKA